ncbi:hypothetical protein FVA81_03370 (plasmid) [Rhizobium sp. WL3]|uniref:hypothetical protein n=1 Tax=Rhizobium sp. WL3 TaxID=2603277 RepID=UPI0011C1DF7E|nr:hypothetical protein [Rhizobium sp. WL3]QEE43676.1 hypothetical protein FVA81_03370 [Rhizobium sp. WL3]
MSGFLSEKVKSAEALHCVLLVTRKAMLPEAHALSLALLKHQLSRVTILRSGVDAATDDLPDNDRFAIEAEACGRDVMPRGIWRLGPLRTVALTVSIARKRRSIARRLRALRPCVLVVFEDRFIDPEAIWLAEARNAKVPAILVRYASSSVESDIWSRRGRRGYSLQSGALAWLRRAFARRYPHHVLADQRDRLLFYPTWDSWALAFSGLAGTDPRIVGGGHVKRVAVMGTAEKDMAEAVTGLIDRFVVTGQPSLDAMPVKRINSDVATRVICALPQWAEHNQLSWERHMELLEQLAAILESSGVEEAVLNVHPKADWRRYSNLADRHRLTISNRPLMEIISSADIFIASWSSTLRWSALLGIPAINLDWAEQAYTATAGTEAIPLSRAPEDFRELLDRLIGDNGFRKSLGERLKKSSNAIGTLDGQACARVVKMIDEVVGSNAHIGDSR